MVSEQSAGDEEEMFSPLTLDEDDDSTEVSSLTDDSPVSLQVKELIAFVSERYGLDESQIESLTGDFIKVLVKS